MNNTGSNSINTPLHVVNFVSSLSNFANDGNLPFRVSFSYTCYRFTQKLKGQLHLQADICWEHTLVCILYSPCSLEYCMASLPVKLHLIATPQPTIKLKTMGAIVSHNALPLYIWQAVRTRIVAFPVCTAPSITHETMTTMLWKW